MYDFSPLGHRFVDWMLLQADASNSRPDPEVFVKDEGIERAQLGRIIDELEDRGLVETQKAFGDLPPWLNLTAPGLSIARDIRQKRDDRATRARACRPQLLSWIYNSGPGTASTVDFFRDDRSIFLGETFSTADVDEAIRYLTGKKLLGVTRTVGGSSAIELTSDGIRCVEEFDADVTKYLGRQADGQVPQVNVRVGDIGAGSSVQMVAGHQQHVQQTATIGVEVGPVRDWATSVTDAAPVLRLPAAEQERLTELLGALRAETDTPTPVRERVKNALKNTVEWMGTISKAAASITLIEHGWQLLNSLGT